MKNWRKVLVREDAKILEVIAVVDRYQTQLAIVVDEANRLIGTVTDGDIRRGILREVPLDRPVKEVLNNNPLVVRQDEDPATVYASMKARSLRSLPILDQEGHIVDVLTLDEIPDHHPRNNPVVLMAGGLGMRLRPLTNDTPKPMLSVGQKPVLESIVENLSDQGFYNFYLAVNYLAEKIESHFEFGRDRKVEIQYLREKDRMGTAGALSLLPEKPNEPILVVNGEHLYQVPYGVVNVDKTHIRGLEEKPTQRYLINAGIYVLNPDVLDLLDPSGAIDMTDLFEMLIDQEQTVVAFPIREYWTDIGQFEDLQKANDHHAREESKS